MTSSQWVSTARVATGRPARFGKQLTAHMGRKVRASWDEGASSGWVEFDREGVSVGRVELSCEEGALVMRMEAAGEHVGRLEQVCGIHLARFGAREGLVVRWEREDGSEGTCQGPLTPEEVAEHMRAKRAAAGDPSSSSR
ncbi:DUF2218 domain-containing protein [Actinomyces sp. B33]|uniref:DUF2218 domain-containing protein n=1 Tax=Actinomyces sp. B33 TaxID=2942131 RepID=UPI002341DCD4|nr:DUF2218 domain-containing protein [Actinomyces sp. B33]MDC4233903.1 DUF2218 domain-containing protein [Actinomyces sp. B33]